jgi:hypothetical protein
VSTASRQVDRLRRDERGSVTVWMIGVTVSAFSLVALLLDGGAMLRARSDAFALAGSAARVGAQQLDPDAAVEGLTVLDPIAAERAVQDYLDGAGVTGTAVVSGYTVTVTVTSEAALQMLRLVGGDTVSFQATASVEAVKVEP